MEIENISYIYGHKRLYRIALRPVINDFLVTKMTTKRDNKKKFNWNLRENAVAAVISFLASKKIFNSAFFIFQEWFIGLLITEKM